MNCANQNCGGEIRRGDRYVAVERHVEVAVKPNLIERIRGRNDIRKVEDAELVAAFHPACAPR